MNDYDFNRLATFNSERARGIAHDPAYVEEMARLKEVFDAEQRAEYERKGYRY